MVLFDFALTYFLGRVFSFSYFSEKVFFFFVFFLNSAFGWFSLIPEFTVSWEHYRQQSNPKKVIKPTSRCPVHTGDTRTAAETKSFYSRAMVLLAWLSAPLDTVGSLPVREARNGSCPCGCNINFLEMPWLSVAGGEGGLK